MYFPFAFYLTSRAEEPANFLAAPAPDFFSKRLLRLLFLFYQLRLWELGVTLLRNKMLAQIDISPYNIDMFDEVEEGSLLIADKRTANALVDATVHAITAGSVKRVGVLFTLMRRRLPPPPPCWRWTSPFAAFRRRGASSSSPGPTVWRRCVVKKEPSPSMTFWLWPPRLTEHSRSWGPSSSLRGATGYWS